MSSPFVKGLKNPLKVLRPSSWKDLKKHRNNAQAEWTDRSTGWKSPSTQAMHQHLYSRAKKEMAGSASSAAAIGSAAYIGGKKLMGDKEKNAMDHELAQAVFQRWGAGLPVAETTFYKAAQVIGVDPGDALLEARFYTMLDHDLSKLASGANLDSASIRIYSAAAGENPTSLVKTASRYQLSPSALVMQKLAQRNWVPDLQMLKMALMAPVHPDGQAADGGAPMMSPAAMGGDAAQPAMAPQEGAMVQQQPAARRYKPSPMAPIQSPPSAEGNLQELVDAARYPEAGQEMGAGGMGPQDAGGGGTDMAPQDAPPELSPEEKLLQVQPDMPPENIERYAAKLHELEQQVGMPINDPQQVQKFIEQMQKEDGKVIDQAIKQIGSAPTKFGPDGSTQTGATPKQPPLGGGAEPTQGLNKVAMRRAWLPG
jgi:hypothetical protein